MFSLIVMAHICFFVYWTNSFLLEFRATIRRRFPRAYLALYLCFKKDNYVFEKEIDDYRHKMSPFVNILLDISKYINDKLELYQKGLIPNEDKELRERVLVLNEFKRRIEKDRAFQGDEKSYQRVEEIVKNKRLNYFKSEVVVSANFSENIKNSNIHASAHSHMNDSITSKLSAMQQRLVDNPHSKQLKLQPGFEQMFELQGPFYGATGTGEEHPDLGSSMSRLPNPNDIQKKSLRKKRGFKPKNLKSSQLDFYDDISKFEWKQDDQSMFQEDSAPKSELLQSGMNAVPVKTISQRVASQIIREEEGISIDASRFKEIEALQENESELVSRNSSLGEKSRNDLVRQLDFSQIDDSIMSKEDIEDQESVLVICRDRSPHLGKSLFSKKTSNSNRLLSEEFGMKRRHEEKQFYPLKSNNGQSKAEPAPQSIQHFVATGELEVKVMPKFDRSHFQRDLKARSRQMSSINKSQIHLQTLRNLGQSDLHSSSMKSYIIEDQNERFDQEDSKTN
ncbi:hypothetical protein FGO68_gene13760 [Halteria grandinella]|uniref:Uncharacterized protein n=1 Tax=Halteria grandinella TaxID=5974 RepID=A0A8J8P4X7_HALGN|nr:hypothetical protein FGO68_gene13760 [Halteria grandinella]